MAEDQDNAQKTEEPTQKRLDDAYDKGEAPKSQEVKHWFMILAIGLAVATAAGPSAHLLRGHLAGYLGHAGDLMAGGGALLHDLRNLALVVLLALAVPMLFLIAGGLAGNILQGRTVLTSEKLKPKLSKISPMAGAKRLFSLQSVAEFLKSLAKLVVIGVISAMLIWPERGRLLDIIRMPMDDILPLVASLALRLVGGVLAAMTVIALADFLWQRQQFIKRLRMTKQEVRDEFKQMEGDPQIKARIRQLRTERTRQRIAKAVPESDVVITNPTHYAVALEYKHGRMAVPLMRAKGVDHLAMRIRTLAKEHNIPIIENPPLARALHAAVDIDQEIPPEHYKAVAEVISYVMKLRGGKVPRR
ncbi:MAG: flagellar biosynthesis protein FlhB [Alphaproteobacteria bacterium]|nr:MAG: flagellar biosynthesis protein FlhB [Alphaproteobacteria bacterium]